MKRAIRKYCFWIIILLAVSDAVMSQDISGGYPVETLQLFTDRTIYITGEKICFSALVILKDDNFTDDLSRVLYCELVTPDGTSVTAGKFIVENSSAQGCLTIPEDAVTGFYYLKSYTRWMRNIGPGGYHYILLKVINPDKAEVVPGEGSVEQADFPGSKDAVGPFRLSADKKTCFAREELKITIHDITIRDITKHEGIWKLALSVVPAFSWDSISFHRDSISSETRDSISAETRGISISGRLLEDKSGNPVPNALVNLSIIGDKDVMAIRTDREGRFYFSLPDYSGDRDIFLCGEEINKVPASIFIDNDFCPRPVNLPSPAFQLTDEEKSTAYSMAVNQQINSAFKVDTLKTKQGEAKNGGSFYGEPDEILLLEKYIDLPSIEEYFSELLGQVNVRKYEGRKIFRFNSTRSEMTIYDPLLLIDMVAVNDIEKILAMSPRLIERIELVNAPYVKGNITYGGIISFFSKNNDFAGIDLPSSGTFINYKFFEDCSVVNPMPPASDNIPDTRNTVYWDPDVKTGKDRPTEISFTAPDTPGRYLILLTCISKTGETFIIREEIEIISN
jgi:hypothetical protein